MNKVAWRMSALICFCTLSSSVWAAKLPVEAYAAHPMVESVRISPDGKKIAVLTNDKNVTKIVVQSLDDPKLPSAALISTDNKEFTLQWFQWVNNDRVLVGAKFPALRRSQYAMSVGGVPTYETRLLSFSADGSSSVNLFKPQSFNRRNLPQFQDDVIDFEPDDGKHVLVEIVEQDHTNDTSVVSVDVETGSRTHVFDSRNNFGNWMTDQNHRVRIGVQRDNADIEIHGCDPDGKNWRKLWAYKALSDDSIGIAGFGKDPNELYIFARHEGKRALFTVNLADPKLVRTLKVANPDGDVYGRLVYSKKTGEVLGLSGASQTDGSAEDFWDQDRKDLISFVDRALPNRKNRVISMSRDENRYVLYSTGVKSAGIFYLGDDAANRIKPFAKTYPQLDEKEFVAKERHVVKARDGLELPTFVSLPLGEAKTQLPTVLLVHGGPQWHDTGGFDMWTQFLVNRGYAVLQVNFRGSTGSGDSLMRAGMRRWGMEMQDDLTDAVQWAIKQGIADPKRVCIVGASYGGYAALMGAAKTPDLYRCAFSFAGVTDLPEMLRESGYYSNMQAVAELQVGSLSDDKQRLKATSPLYLAAQIKIPVLLMHGTEDRSVTYYHGKAMDEALTAAGKPHRFVTLDRGDHHLSLYDHSLVFFTELERFLADNIGKGAAQ